MPKIPILRRFTAPLGLTRIQPQPIVRRFATFCHSVNGSHPQPQAAPVIKLKKKALIIGIQYAGTNCSLRNTHRDAKLWRDLLIRKYGFDAKDIVMMLDEGEASSELWPTKLHILREIDNFVDGVNAGDELVFYYSGHTSQVETEDANEDDGMNEVLLPVDYNEEDVSTYIVDNDLRELLVNRLPIGSKLTAVFDSCHSGTLLDLDHYLCNEVYHPFLCRAPSKQKSMWMNMERKNAHGPEWTVEGEGSPRPVVRGRAAIPDSGTRIHQRLRESEEKVSCIDTALKQLQDSADKQRRFQVQTREHTSSRGPSRANSGASDLTNGNSKLAQVRTDTQGTDSGEGGRRTSVQTRQTSIQIRQATGQSEKSERAKTRLGATRQNSLASVISSLNLCRTASPEPLPGAMTACVEGNCILNGGPRLDVTSLAATHDPEEAYEGTDGYSMTKVLVEILDNDPHPTYHQLAYKLGQICCAKVKEIEKKNRKRKEDNMNRKKKKRVLERVNWTVPQIGSMMPDVLNSHFMKKNTPSR